MSAAEMHDVLHPRNRHTYRPWTPTDVDFMRRHPDMSAAELGEALGRTASSVASARHRFGRYPTGAESLCVCCEERIVFAESPTAKRWRLCKGCYLRELRMREQEEAESNAVRQMRHKHKVRRERG